MCGYGPPFRSSQNPNKLLPRSIVLMSSSIWRRDHQLEFNNTEALLIVLPGGSATWAVAAAGSVVVAVAAAGIAAGITAGAAAGAGVGVVAGACIVAGMVAGVGAGDRAGIVVRGRGGAG